MLTEIVTIGAYGWRADDFFAALQAAGVDTFCDVRLRRGVRGATYAFANAARLQARLAPLQIRYLHRLDLAPSRAVRQLQDAADAAAHTPKRQRLALSPAFAQAYQQQCLDGFDSAAFAASLDPDTRVLALFCVEGEPTACHRSLLADRLAHDLGLPLRHLQPAPAGLSADSSRPT